MQFAVNATRELLPPGKRLASGCGNADNASIY
jgi:hypothetical protein